MNTSTQEKIKVKRVPKRGHYDKETIYSVLDKEFMCHVAFTHEGYPVVIPTLYGRQEDLIFVHGSMASRMMKNLADGFEISVSVTKVNGLVLARSAFHHSVNYESVVLFGKAFPVVEKEEKLEALKCITEQVIKNRWDEVRKPNDKELKGTMVLKISLENASAKIRSGGPIDEPGDYQLPIWAGEIPIEKRYGKAIRDELTEKDVPVSESIKALNID